MLSVAAEPRRLDEEAVNTRMIVAIFGPYLFKRKQRVL
jgi:hypothetical protein